MVIRALSPRRSFTLLLLTSIALPVTALVANDRAISQQIDKLVEANYRRKGIKPNRPTSDEVFLRRAYLDIIGRVPTFKEAQQFLNAEGGAKRGQLIRTLLNSEGHVSHAYNYWADILRVQSSMERGAGEAYADWVKDALRENKPYDQMVRDLVTAEGYVWDNGAVGYYMRDAGMPLDNMSNTTQIFLGTQLVCAQCHNHPFDRWKQKEYYEMAAYTYGMETRVDPEKIVKLDEKMDKMAKRAERRESRREMNQQVRRALRDLLEPLSYKVQFNDEKMLQLPHDYQYKDADPRDEVGASTIFGKRVSGRSSKKLDSYAKWMTNPENPRFTKVIVNRLWKRVMGVGLVEPVDDFKDGTEASNPALLTFLEKQMVNMGYDMRRFLGVLYNTRTYQRESSTGDINVDDYHFPGPVLRRMSGEQIWDSLLTSIIPAVDERQGSKRYKKRYEEMKVRAQALTGMKKNSKALLDTAKEIAAVEHDHDEKTKGLRKRVADAREANDSSLAKRLTKEMRAADKERDEKVDAIKKNFENSFALATTDSPAMMKMEEKKSDKKKYGSDPRWKGYSKDYVRASELRSPAPVDHFLRQFGQSDRETIQAAHSEASVAQVLNLLNGDVFDKLSDSNSQLSRGLNQLYGDDEKQDFLFLSLLTRYPTDDERELINQQVKAAGDAEEGYEKIVWALLNTKELLFIQ